MMKLGLIKPALVPVLLVCSFIASVFTSPVTTLSVTETEEGTEFEGTANNVSWQAVLREIKMIDGGRLKSVRVRIKDGEREQEVYVSLDTRLRPGPLRSILGSIKDYVNAPRRDK